MKWPGSGPSAISKRGTTAGGEFKGRRRSRGKGRIASPQKTAGGTEDNKNNYLGEDKVLRGRKSRGGAGSKRGYHPVVKKNDAANGQRREKCQQPQNGKIWGGKQHGALPRPKKEDGKEGGGEEKLGTKDIKSEDATGGKKFT